MILTYFKIILLLACVNVAFAKDEHKIEDVKSKQNYRYALGVETGMIMLSNKTSEVFGSKKAGKGTTSSGFILGRGEYFILDDLSVNVQTFLSFDFNQSLIMLRGYDIGGRYYFMGSGRNIVGNNSFVDYNFDEIFNQFAEVYLGKHYYRLAYKPEDYDSDVGKSVWEGSYYQVSIGGGVNISFVDKSKLTVRLLYSPISATDDGDHLVFSEIWLSLGYQYNFF